MKIAVISDIHGNLPALQAVTADLEKRQPDYVVVNGDIINRGAKSLACWQFVQDKVATKGWQVLRGNHEDYVLQHADPNAPTDGIVFELNHLSYWTYEQMKGEISAIDALPNAISLCDPQAGEARFRHASMRNNRDGLFPEYSEAEVRARIAPAPPLFVTSHIHAPYIRPLAGTLLVNTGSVGQVRDGDMRGSYGWLECRQNQWKADIKRVAYDVAQADQDYHDSGMLTDTSPVAKIIYHEWRLATPLLYEWIGKYQSDVLAAKIPLIEAVQAYLDERQLTAI